MRPKYFLYGVLLALAILTGCIEKPLEEPMEKPPEGPPEPPEEPPKPPEPGPGAPPVAEEFPFPAVHPDAPSPAPPGGGYKSLKLGNLEITYFTPVTIRNPSILERGTDIIIKVKNRGGDDEILAFTPVSELRGQIPEQIIHFFSFYPELIDQAPYVKIAPQEEQEIRYFLSEEYLGEFTITIDFWLKDKPGEKVTARIEVVFEDYPIEKLPLTSIVYGVVSEDGKPVQGAVVMACLYNGRHCPRERTDDQGRYAIALPAVEDLRGIFGERELSFSSLGYFITVEQEGYEFHYQDGLYPERGSRLRVDIALEKMVEKPEYSLRWEKQVNEPYGFWWVLPTPDWRYVFATQAKHPPELKKPTRLYLFDKGSIAWSYSVGEECWGGDVNTDGTLFAAGCHDGGIYVINVSGASSWTARAPSMVRWVRFSPDGRYLIAGPTGDSDLALFEAANGRVVWGDSSTREWLRNAAFSPDGSMVVVGMSDGHLMAFDLQGNKLWHRGIGEFPMFLGVSRDGNVFAAGKSRTLFAFDREGNLKWRYRIPDHVVTAGDISEDGKIALGTVGGWIYLFSEDGQLLWRRHPGGPGFSPRTIGHNAIAITPDGRYIIAGTAPENEVILLNEKGTLLWLYEAEQELLSKDMMGGVVHVAVSRDATKILAAYGDSYIREFGR
jgi:hypothetical protein